MHQVIYALVTASTADQALSWTADVFNRLVGATPHAEAVSDYYVMFDDDSATVAGSAWWGDLPVAVPVDLEDGQELLGSGWQATIRGSERNLKHVREDVDDLNAAVIIRDEGLIGHAYYNLGTYHGPAAHLYDEFADSVRYRERLEQLVGLNDYLQIAPADVHHRLWGLWPMAFLRETLPDRGTVVRTVIDDMADTYRVEYMPLSGGVVTDEWTVLGGSAGYDVSMSPTTAAAHALVGRVRTASHDDILVE